MDSKKRIFFIVKSNNIEYWQNEIIKKVFNLDLFFISLVVIDQDVINKSSLNIFSAYKKLDRFIFKSSIDAFGSIPYQDLPKVDRILHFKENSFIKNLRKELELKNAEFVLNFTDLVIEGDLNKYLKFGIWEFVLGLKINKSFLSTGILEILEQRPTSISYLVARFSSNKSDKILYKSSSLTDPHSVSRNLNKICMKSISYPLRVINKIYVLKNMPKQPFFDYQENSMELDIDKKILFLKMTKHAIFFLKNRIRNKFYHEQWVLLYNNYSDPMLKKIKNYKKIIPPSDRFYADPFLIRYKGKKFIFIEELLYKQNKGFISVIEVGNKGDNSKPVKVIEEDYHLSYPYLIKENKKIYMIPETSKNRTISLYECNSFPYKWTFKMHLMEDVDASDTTIISYNGKYWMFCNIVENIGASSYDELFLFYSEHLLSKEWNAHPKNPIVSDVSRARSAGNIFKYNEKLIRPSQNSSNRYGYGMVYNQILKLNEKDYSETKIHFVNPNCIKGTLGIHTSNTLNDFTIADRLIRVKI